VTILNQKDLKYFFQFPNGIAGRYWVNLTHLVAYLKSTKCDERLNQDILQKWRIKPLKPRVLSEKNLEIKLQVSELKSFKSLKCLISEDKDEVHSSR